MTVSDLSARALVVERFDDVPHLARVEVPEPGPAEVLVRVRAASVNAFDWKAAGGMFRDTFTYRFPVTVGRDWSGVVAAVGPQVSGVAPGDEVFGYLSGMELHRGSFADYLVVRDGFVPKPAGLGHLEAACLPLAGVVAARCVDGAAPAAGDTVLVVGAPGGVGSFAVQLAAARGAHVIATGPAGDEAYLKELGAGEVVPPGADLPERLAGRTVAGLIDLVHRGEAFLGVAALVAPGGRAVSVHRAADEQALGARGVTAVNVGSTPDRDVLARLGDLAARGELRVPIQATYRLEDAAAALTALRTRHARGKIAIDHTGEAHG